MPFSVTANVTSGSGTVVTWDIPAYVMGDFIILTVQANSTSTTSTLSGGDANFTWNRVPATGTGNTYPTWVGARYAPNLSITTTATMSVSAGWRALATVVHGSKGLSGNTQHVAAQNNHSAPSHGFTAGGCYVVVNHGRLAATGTSTVTSGGSAWAEVLDSYASNLQAAVAYQGPLGSGNTANWVSTWSTSGANTTRASVTRYWNNDGAAPYGTVSAALPAMEAEVDATVDDTVFGPLSATIPQMTADVDGTLKLTGTASATIPQMTADVDGTVKTSGSITAALPEMMAVFTASVKISGSVSANLPEMSSDLDGTVTEGPGSGPITATLPQMTATLSGDLLIVGPISASMAEMQADINAGVRLSATLSGALPEMQADLQGNIPQLGALNSVIPPMTAVVVGRVYVSGERVYLVEQENRTYMVEPETRTYNIPSENRITYVEPEEDYSLIEGEDRTYYIT